MEKCGTSIAQRALSINSSMANPDTIALAACAEAEGLESVLVGGNAVNLHAYFRTTFDVDLLIREKDLERWLAFFQQRGYREHRAFCVLQRVLDHTLKIVSPRFANHRQRFQVHFGEVYPDLNTANPVLG